MSMILIIPREIEGLKEVEEALNQEMIEKIFSTQPGKPELTLYLPKFKLESSFSLKTPLSAVTIFPKINITKYPRSPFIGLCP
jgi:serine protease inhibitor